MKVMVIGHTYCAAINRKKWLTLARMYDDIELVVVIPERWRHTFFTLHAHDAYSDNTKNCRFAPLKAKYDGNEGRYRFGWWQLASLIASERPSLIQVEQGAGAFVYFQVHLLQNLFCSQAKTIFFTWINWEVKHSLWYYFFRYWLELGNTQCSSGAIVGNSAARTVLLHKKFDKPIMVLPQIGVELPDSMPVKKIVTPRKCIGYVGRMLAKKGLYILIDAFVSIAHTYQDWDLVLIGCGPDLLGLKQYAYLSGFHSRIVFKDPLPHTKVFAALADFDIFVLPSYDTPDWKEQFGHVLIEAMVSGVPVIGSDAGAIPDVIGDAGMVVKQKDSDALAYACGQYIDSQTLRERYVSRAYDRVDRLFSHGAIARKTYNFWQQKIV